MSGDDAAGDRITARLDELKQEFVRGQARLREMEAQQAALRDTLLRISGAIQVLEEVQAHAGDGGPG